MIGARLNWLLSHGKGETGAPKLKRFIQVDIDPREMDGNVEIAAPLLVTSVMLSAMSAAMGDNWPAYLLNGQPPLNSVRM